MSNGIRRAGTLAGVLSAGLLLAACGSSNNTPAAKASPTPSPSPTPTPAHIASVDACVLVTAAEASSAAGTPVTNLAAAGGTQIPGACIYGSSDGTTSVVVFAQAYPDASSAQSVSPQQLAAALQGAYGVADAKPVSGIGDKAVEYTLNGSAGNGIVIFVFKSNVVFLIAMVPSKGPSVIEQLATTAAGRL